jgi:hypothetical protein
MSAAVLTNRRCACCGLLTFRALTLQKAAGGSPALDVAVTLDLVDNFGNIVRVCLS